jgi:hypothetical protein
MTLADAAVDEGGAWVLEPTGSAKSRCSCGTPAQPGPSHAALRLESPRGARAVDLMAHRRTIPRNELVR